MEPDFRKAIGYHYQCGGVVHQFLDHEFYYACDKCKQKAEKFGTSIDQINPDGTIIVEAERVWYPPDLE